MDSEIKITRNGEKYVLSITGGGQILTKSYDTYDELRDKLLEIKRVLEGKKSSEEPTTDEVGTPRR